MKDKVSKFYAPLGVGLHLREWGVHPAQIVELDWWEEATHEDLVFKCAPAQHFSGRGLSDRGATLWGSWVIQSPTENIFFSGDSGYGPHFKEIGDTYGPFDFAMMECGQYNEMWKEIHMMPEETAQAGIDIKAKFIMPIHWGAFKLAMHSWTDPIERVIKKAQSLDLPVIAPKIGEPIYLEEKTPTLDQMVGIFQPASKSLNCQSFCIEKPIKSAPKGVFHRKSSKKLEPRAWVLAILHCFVLTLPST